MDYEDVVFQKSKVIEDFLLNWGLELCKAIKSAETNEELLVLRNVVTEFAVLASAYSESINGFREDLGVSLGEAIEFKRQAILNETHSKEWEQYLKDDEETLNGLMQQNDG